MDRKYSYLWNFFVVKDADACRAICYECNQVLSYRTTVTNLKKHLKSRHPEIELHNASCVSSADNGDASNGQTEDASTTVQAEVIKTPVKRHHEKHESGVIKLKKLEADNIYSKKMTFNNKKTLDNYLLNLFTKDFQKVSLVKDAGFRSFVSALNPQYQIPDVKTICGVLLPELHEKIKQYVEDSLQESFSVTLTAESWLSHHNEAFIIIKANFLNQNFEVMSALLDCFSFTEQPSSQKLEEIFKNVVSEWSISSKIRLVVCNTDNVYEYKSEQLQWDNINCVVHTIGNIVAGGFQLVSEILLKVQSIVVAYKQNRLATLELLRHQRILGNSPENLVLSYMTDWYSVYKMLQRFVEVEDYVKTTVSHLEIGLTLLTDEEWVICKEVVEIVKPFETFMKSLYEEKFIISSVAVILLKGLETMLNELLLKKFHKVTQSVLSKFIESMTEQFSNVYNNNILLISTFLDPRFKDVIFEQSIRDSLKQTIINMVSSISVAKSHLSISISDEYVSSDDNTLSIWKAFQSKASESRPPLYTSKSKKDSRASVEIQQYLDEGLLPRNENPLQWWKINGHMYPHLKNLLKQNLAVTCIAVTPENLFSKQLQILNERRSRLSLDEAKLVLFINANEYLTY